jgi:CSLREA domain-containing protein
MTLIPLRPRIHSRTGKTAVTLFALAFIGWFVLPASLWNRIQPTARAASLTVNSLGDTHDAALGNGICADALGACTLRAALEEANTLGAGGAPNTINFSVTGTINLTGGLPTVFAFITINGPGSSLLTVRRDTGGDYNIFLVMGADVTISGLTVTNGKTPDGGPGSTFGGSGANGGGIYNMGNLTLRDVVVIGNRTGNGGNATNPGSTFGGPGGYGGGIYSPGSLTMTDVTISNNTTGHGGNGGYGHHGGRGGGIYATGSLTMTHCSVTGNNTGTGGVGSNAGASGGPGGDGAGILAETGTFNFTDIIVSGNNTGDGAGESGSGGYGGGIFVIGTATLTNSTISSNTTGDGSAGFVGQGGLAGGIYNGGSLIIIGSTINNNSTGTSGPNGGSNGGGIFNGATLRMFNCTVSGNSTTSVGGGLSVGGTTTLTNVTITNNLSDSDNNLWGPGGGLYAFSGNLTLNNTIVAGNFKGGTATANDIDAPVQSSSSNNLIGTGGSGGLTNGVNNNQVGVSNALLGPLAENGGPTRTHALLAGSSALDAGNNALALDTLDAALITDQRGAARLADSPDADSTATVDIGAFEFHSSLENVPDKTTNEDTQLLFSFAVGDTGGTVTSVAVSSDNQALVPDANLLLLGAASVRTLRITPIANQSGSAHITLTVVYAGGSVLTDTFLLTVTPVNDVPTFNKGADQTVNEDSSAQTITNWATGISAGPNESGQSLTFLVTDNTNTRLFSVGPTISDSGTLTYTAAPNAFGTALVTVALKDNGGTANGGQDTTAAQTFTINLTAVNDVPTFTKGADQTVNEDSGFQSVTNWATGISPGPNESTQSVTFLVTNNTNAGLFSFAPSINSNGTLTYVPASNASGSAAITIVLRDNGGTTNGGQDTSGVQTFNINVTAVNDPPVNSVPFSQITNQNVPLVFSSGNFNTISVFDVDAGTDAVRITLTATQGTLTLGATTGITFVTGDGNDDVTMAFTATISAVNASLNGLRFQPNTNFNGAASIQITTDDLGHTGSGGAKTDTDVVAITVRAGGTAQFSSATYAVAENFGIATITVSRTGGSSGAGSVTYSTSGGTATGGATCSSGADYLNTSGTLAWANGDSSAKSFNILFCGDSINEPNETVIVALSGLTGSIALGAPASATLTILNDDAPVVLMLETSERAVALDSTIQIRDPFSLTNVFNLSTDQRRRVSLFVWRLGLLAGDTASNVTALAEDDQGGVYNLTVEYVGPLPAISDITQVVVRLPDSVVGAPRDLWIKVSLRGPSSNRAVIKIAFP